MSLIGLAVVANTSRTQLGDSFQQEPERDPSFLTSRQTSDEKVKGKLEGIISFRDLSFPKMACGERFLTSGSIIFYNQSGWGLAPSACEAKGTSQKMTEVRNNISAPQ